MSQIPALDLPLTGLHLIEASAGTGKTWTLSALIVRLILQAQKNPAQMIATTFTRAAAAELRGRIRARIEEIRSVFDLRLDIEKDRIEGRTNAQTYSERLQTWQQYVAADAFRAYIVASDAGQNWDYARERLQYALDSFDDLFVGTLDSFCQKLLHEFAFDSGQAEKAQISEQERELIAEIVHDALRRWRSEQDADVIALLLAGKQLKTVEDYHPVLSTVMNFLSAELVAVEMPQIDLTEIRALLAELQQIDVDAYREFMLPSGAARAVMAKNRAFTNNGAYFFSFIDKLNAFGLPVLLNLSSDDPEAKLLAGFANIDGQFVKAGAAAKARFEQIGSNDIFIRLEQARAALKDSLEQIDAHVQYELCRQVREQLPVKLAERGETTFSQQMRKLADALDDPDFGLELARQIRYRYPIALVDEFQDTNSDQDRMIARIYRQEVDERSCLILVGDPKQAIYGFRGGDVQTYLAAKRYIAAHPHGQIHGLTINQRSIAPLVAAVDQVFGQKADMGEGIPYPRVQAAQRPHPQLIDAEGSDVAALRLLQLGEKQDECSACAWQIIDLLAQASDCRLALHDGQQVTAICPNDIAVLGYSNRELDQVQQVLAAAGVPTARPSRQSVFESAVAQDVAALLQAMLTPYHEQRLRRALSGVVGGWTLAKLNTLDSNSQLLAEQQAAFAEEGVVWQQQGFLAAWQQLADRLELYPRLAQQAHAERHLINLRHLLELLHEQSEWTAGTHHLLAWLMRQISRPMQREWEMERRLPSQAGVQLMTIHASKGLEFAVVLVVGLDKRRQKKRDVQFFMQSQQRKISFDSDQPDIQAQHDERVQAEQRRLAYVALTRASHRLYVMITPLSTKKLASNYYESVLRYWLGEDVAQVADGHTQMRYRAALQHAPDFQYRRNIPAQTLLCRPLPQRRFASWGITSFSAMIREHDAQYISRAVEQPDYDQDVDDSDELAVDDVTVVPTVPANIPLRVLQKILEPLPPLDADAFDLTPPSDWHAAPDAAEHEVYFERDDEWRDQASFDFAELEQPHQTVIDQAFYFEIAPSAISAAPVMIPMDEAELWLEREQALWAEDVEELELPSPLEAYAADDRARFEFPRGTTSGNCLHKILEYLDPSKPEIWHETFAKQMKEHGIQGIDPHSLVPWFEHVLYAPLPAGAQLATLGFRERVREMEFYLSLPHGEIQQERLRQVLSEQQIEIANLRQTQGVRYLKGTMDLVYQHQGRFYVADYKSNWLGIDKKQGRLLDYHVSVLPQAMQAHQYGLQAALYLVALHRYLKTRVGNYQPEQQLGGAVYLFLRGMRRDQAEQGIWHWCPPVAWIERLDAALNGESS